MAFSDLIAAVAGAVGKQSPLGQQVLDIRKHVTGSDQPSPAKVQPEKQ
jgi:hypothetical protein